MGGREDRGTHRNMDIPMDGRTDRIQFYKMSAGGKKGWTMDIHSTQTHARTGTHASTQISYYIIILDVCISHLLLFESQ